MFAPQKYFAIVNWQRLKQSVAQTKAAVEDGDGRLLFWNKFAVEKYEHAHFLPQRRRDAEEKITGQKGNRGWTQTNTNKKRGGQVSGVCFSAAHRKIVRSIIFRGDYIPILTLESVFICIHPWFQFFIKPK